MQMSEFEILQDYKSAKDKNKQISILADMNLCSCEEIIEILMKNGAVSGVKKKKIPGAKRAKRIKWTKEMENDVLRFFNEGDSIERIADKMGLSEGAVRSKLANLKAKKKQVRHTDTVDITYQKQLEALLKEDRQQWKAVNKQIEGMIAAASELHGFVLALYALSCDAPEDAQVVLKTYAKRLSETLFNNLIEFHEQLQNKIAPAAAATASEGHDKEESSVLYNKMKELSSNA